MYAEHGSAVALPADEPSAFQPTYNLWCVRLATPTIAETHCVRAHLSWHLLTPLASQQYAFIRIARSERVSTISLHDHLPHTWFELHLVFGDRHPLPCRTLTDPGRQKKAGKGSMPTLQKH